MNLSLDPIRPYLPLVYGAVVLAVIVAFAVQGSRIKSLKRKNDEQGAALLTYAGAQKTNLATIATLKAANQAWEKNCTFDTAAQAKAVADLDVAQAEHDRRAAATTKEIEYVYVNSPTARAWGRTGVPRDIADRLP
jgi:hypothetical protein